MTLPAWFGPFPKSRFKLKPGPAMIVFLTGFRINQPWNYWKRWQIHRGIRQILQELENTPNSGYLGHEYWPGNPSLILQYWRDRDQLIHYARNKDASHFPYWFDFNTYLSEDASVGLWHEMYQVDENAMEGLYRNMQPIGLGRVLGCEAMYGDAGLTK